MLAKDKKSILLCVCVNVVRLSLYYSLPFVIALALHIPLKMNVLIDVMALSSFVTMANNFIQFPEQAVVRKLSFHCCLVA